MWKRFAVCFNYKAFELWSYSASCSTNMKLDWYLSTGRRKPTHRIVFLLVWNINIQMLSWRSENSRQGMVACGWVLGKSLPPRIQHGWGLTNYSRLIKQISCLTKILVHFENHERAEIQCHKPSKKKKRKPGNLGFHWIWFIWHTTQLNLSTKRLWILLIKSSNFPKKFSISSTIGKFG